MNTKRIVTLLLSAILAISFVACGESTPASTASSSAPEAASSEAGTAETSPAEATNEVPKPERIALMVNGTFMVPEAGQEDIVNKYKELTGITLDIIQPAHNQYMEKVNLVFATGDLPDVLTLDVGSMYSYASNGVLHDMKPYFDRSEAMQRLDQSIVNDSLIDGKLYTIPKGRGNGTITHVRKDWLDQLGMEVPTNYDEFLAMLRGFKTLGSDIIPYTAPGIIYEEYPSNIYNRDFFHQAVPDFVQVDGKWVDGMLEPTMVPALERMSSAFAEGLIDKEIITNKTSTCRDKIASGTSGTFNYWAGLWSKTLLDNLQATDPNANLVPIPAIAETQYLERVAFGLSMTTKAENPEGIFKYFLEYMYDQGEGQMLFTHGVEGIHYEMEGETLNKLANKANPTQPAGQVFLLTELNINNWTGGYALDPLVIESMGILEANRITAFPVPTNPALEKHSADIYLLRTETLADIVYGNTTVEEGLEKYKASSAIMVETALAALNS